MKPSLLTLCMCFLAAAAAPPAARPAPLRISGVVMQSKLIHIVQPEYPEAARKKNIQGDVHLDVVIAKDGLVKSARVSDGDKELGKAAAKAVKQWKYASTLLNGEPVEVETTVELQFHLNPPPAKPAQTPHL